jgi:hypothetical protein
MQEKVRSLEQQETGRFVGFGAPIADNSGLSLGSSCVVISCFADGMRQRKRNGHKIEWGLDRMRQPAEVALVASSPSVGSIAEQNAPRIRAGGWRDRTGGENSHCRSDEGF